MNIRGGTLPSVRHILAALLLLACGPARAPAPPIASTPMTTPTPSPRVPLVFARGATLALGDLRLVLEDIVSETIEAAPDDANAYPAGSGVTVTVSLGGERGSMTLLSPGYTSTPVSWLAGYRVELVRADDRGAQILVDRVTDRVAASQTIELRRGDAVQLHGRVRLEFRGHGHKMVEPGMESPLLVRVAFDGRDQQYALHPPREVTFWWQDLRFTLGRYTYDEAMEIVVDRLALEPVVGQVSTTLR